MNPRVKYYWGKFVWLKSSKKVQMIWCGPMTEKQMLDYDDCFRHNRSSAMPVLPYDKGDKNFVDIEIPSPELLKEIDEYLEKLHNPS